MVIASFLWLRLSTAGLVAVVHLRVICPLARLGLVVLMLLAAVLASLVVLLLKLRIGPVAMLLTSPFSERFSDTVIRIIAAICVVVCSLICDAFHVCMSPFLLILSWLLFSDALDILKMECGLTGNSGFRHGLVALAWPTFTDQDMLFRDIDAMRDSPATEWAMVLFNRWAPPDYVATLEDDADV